jgi:hypothetical protein
MVKGIVHYLGYFGSVADAAIAYNYFIAYHGLNKRLNQISGREWHHD